MPQEQVKTDLLSPAARKLIEDVRAFCTSEEIVSLTIKTPEEYQAASELLKKLKGYTKEVTTVYRQAKDPIVRQGKDIDAEFKPVISAITERSNVITRSRGAFEREIERKRIEEQRKADEAARKEREKKEAQAEAARKRAAEAAAAGDTKKAEREEARAATREAEASTVAAPVVAPAAPKAEGLTTVRTWKGRIKPGYQKAFIDDCIKKGMYNLITVDEKALNAQAKACKGEMVIEGVEWYQDVSSRATR